MRLIISTILLSVGYQTAVSGFLNNARLHPSVGSFSSSTQFSSAVIDLPKGSDFDETSVTNKFEVVPARSVSSSRTGEEYKSRLEATLLRLRLKDATSPKLLKEVSERVQRVLFTTSADFILIEPCLFTWV